MSTEQLTELARRANYCAQHLAAALNLKRRTLERQFQSQLGCAPGEWLAQQRMCDAILLLKHRLSTKEVATAVAFRDRASFSREFRRRLDCTPAQYQFNHFGVNSRRLEPPERSLLASTSLALSQTVTLAGLPEKQMA